MRLEHGSLAEGFEGPIAMAAMDEELVVARLLHEARVHELRHQVSCGLTLIRLVLQVGDLVLQLGEASHLVVDLRLLGHLLLLLGLDLCLGSASFRAHLEQLAPTPLLTT